MQPIEMTPTETRPTVTGPPVGSPAPAGAVVVGLWWVSGTVGHLTEDPRTLEEAFLATNSHRMESLSTVAPIAYGLDWLLYFSDASQTLSFGIVTMLGIVLAHVEYGHHVAVTGERERQPSLALEHLAVARIVGVRRLDDLHRAAHRPAQRLAKRRPDLRHPAFTHQAYQPILSELCGHGLGVLGEVGVAPGAEGDQTLQGLV